MRPLWRIHALPNDVVHIGVIRKVQVADASQNLSRSKRNASCRLGRVSRGAGNPHQQIAQKLAHGVPWITGERGRQKMVADTIKQRDILAVVVEYAVGIFARPLLVEGVAKSQVLDPRASGVEDFGGHLCSRGAG